MFVKLLCALATSAIGISGVSSTFQMGDGKGMVPMVFHQPSYGQFKSGFGPSFNEFSLPAPEPAFSIQALSLPKTLGISAAIFNNPEPEPIIGNLGSKDSSLGVGAIAFNMPEPQQFLESSGGNGVSFEINENAFNMPEPEPSIGNSGAKGDSFGIVGNTFHMAEPEPFERNFHVKSGITGNGGNTFNIPEPEPYSGSSGGKGGSFGRSDTIANIPEPEPFGGNSGGRSGSFYRSGNGIPEPEPFIGASGGKGGPFGGGRDSHSVPEPEPLGRNIDVKGNANDIFPFQRNTFTGKKAYQPILPGFPEVSIPDGFKDPCFHRVKAAFAKAYPSLPKMTEGPRPVIAEPMPRYVKDLPHYAYPTYSANGIIYVPYRMPTTNYPLFIPFNASVEGKLELDRHPLLLPYPQLAASQPKYGREYPIYIPFSTKDVRAYPEHTPCGNDIFLPFQVGKKQFFRYRQFNLVLPRESTRPAVSSAIQSINSLKSSARTVIPSFTPISPLVSVVPSFAPIVPMSMPLIPMKFSSFMPPPIPMSPMIQMNTKDDFGPIFGSPASVSWDSGSNGYSGFGSPAGISWDSGYGGYSGFGSPASVSWDLGSRGYTGFPAPAGISWDSGSVGSQWDSVPFLSAGSFVQTSVQDNNPAYSQASPPSASINTHHSGSLSSNNLAGKGSSLTSSSSKKRGYY